jgi:NAD(P)-dependent dehydrogenase (short-subunit alcohol dehydrogenase family)
MPFLATGRIAVRLAAFGILFLRGARMRFSTAIGIVAGVGLGCVAAARALRARRAIQFAGTTVVIFGGSRGLGLALAREFAREHAHVVLAARDEAELARAAADVASQGGSVTTIACDLEDRGQVERTIQRIVHDRGSIDVLVNNAGIIQVGPMEHMTLEDFEHAMKTHFWGPLVAIRAALPHMRVPGGARRIVNISSIGGKVAVPHLLPYSASKFALTGLSEGLRSELGREGFAVTTVCPGLMRTGSTYNAMFKGQHRREFAWFHIANATPGFSIAAHRAARRIVDACRHGDPELVLTPGAQLAAFANGVSPSLTARALSLANWLLPRAGDETGNRARSGWQSVSRYVPSAVTRLADRATIEHNELPDASRP